MSVDEIRKEIGTKYANNGLLSELNVPNMVRNFNDLVRKNVLTDNEYSVLLSSIWQRGRTQEWTTEELHRLFSSPQCRQEFLMKEEEYKYFREISTQDLTLYRCMSITEYESKNYRIAWTLNPKVAENFWKRGGEKDVVARLNISDTNRHQIKLIAYLNHRYEEEVLLFVEKDIVGIELIKITNKEISKKL